MLASGLVLSCPVPGVFQTGRIIGRNRDPIPGQSRDGPGAIARQGADEVVELENGATALALRYRCVIVCMYDTNTVSGRLVLDGGFGTHPLAVYRGALQHNPYYETQEKTTAA
jgi:hypothetical protein